MSIKDNPIVTAGGVLHPPPMPEGTDKVLLMLRVANAVYWSHICYKEGRWVGMPFSWASQETPIRLASNQEIIEIVMDCWSAACYGDRDATDFIMQFQAAIGAEL